MGYSKEIYDKANSELSRRRHRAFIDAENRRARIYEELPSVRELEQKLTHTGVAAARAVFAGGDTKTELMKLRDENLKIQQEMRTLLQSRGYTPEDLEERYLCAACRDKGYIDGRMCTCMKKLLRDIAYSELNERSPLSLDNSRFETFSLDWYQNTPDPNGNIPRRRMEKMLSFCKNYAENFSRSSKSILMMGNTGLGKTHLSLAIAGRVTDLGFGVIYGSAPDLLAAIEKETFSRDSDGAVLDRLEQCDLLILDDLGTEYSKAFTRSAVYNLLNARLARDKATIINTNLSIPELQREYSDRLISRVIGEHIHFTFIGDDIRIAKKRADFR